MVAMYGIGIRSQRHHSWVSTAPHLPGCSIPAPNSATEILVHARPNAAATCPKTIAARSRSQKRTDRERILPTPRSEEHTSELQSLMRISYAVFCLKKKKPITQQKNCSSNITSTTEQKNAIHTTH